jgi:hypothetical protein
LKLVGQPFDFGLDRRLVDQRGLGEEVALTMTQGLALRAEPQPLVVGQFEGQELDFALGGVERRLATGERLLG